MRSHNFYDLIFFLSFIGAEKQQLTDPDVYPSYVWKYLE